MSSARRQASTTSLSKFARANSPDVATRSADFCNAFWGLGDGGVDVLFARMRGAARTIEELRIFFKERASVEEEYAKRLAKLSKVGVGRDEIGELRSSLDTLRLETEKQASFHLQLAQQIRTDIEGQSAAFAARQTHFKKTFQAAIEKEFKAKQTQEQYVKRAQEKYESDCLRINSYTAQSSLVQGKDLEKINMKLERAQQTVQANERDFANFARAFQDTVAKWEQDWKAFCDGCQDLEEERMEFMKDNMWAYANAVSTVCVSDDESCERLRLALEQLEVDKDMENFVRDYGTGNAIPDPPAFVNYTTPEAAPSSNRPTTRPAQFSRVSQRAIPARLPSTAPPGPEDDPVINTAGVGAGGGGASRRGTVDEGLSRAPTRGSTRNGHVNGTTSPGAPATRTPAASSPPQTFRAPRDPNLEPIDPTAKTMLKIGEKAYEVDLSRDPQQTGGSSGRGGVQRNGTLPGQGKIGDQGDLLAQTMEELNASSAANSTRRNSIYRPQMQNGPANSAQPSGPGQSSSLSPPGSSGAPPPSTSPSQMQQNRDYHRISADQVVGAFPMSSRPSSPNPPTANFFPSNKQNLPPSDSGVSVENVLADYHQSFPGERKSVSSRRNSFVGAPGQSQSPANAGAPQGMARPVSREGHAGIGANGRSPSPQPVSRGISPGVQIPSGAHRSSLVSPGSVSVAGTFGGLDRNPSLAHRAASPNTVGIALDPTGRVAMDHMADAYRSQQQPPPQQSAYGAPPPQQHPAPPPHHHHQQPPRHQPSYSSGGNGMQHAPAPAQGYPYGVPPPTGYAAVPPQQHAAYAQHPPPPPQQPIYSAPPQQQPVYQPPMQQQPSYQAPPPPHAYGPPNGAGVQRGPSMQGYGGYSPARGPSYHQQQQQQQQQQQYGRGGYGRVPSPQRSPSPQPPQQQLPPTGAFTEDGKGILFYVKALYDYTATIEEEFDFQSGDIIAVTATPEDGWWSGELLDESRRQPGRHVFPSNFVTLF